MQIDIKHTLDLLGIKYKQVGKELRASCPSPNHPDENPSWFINIENGTHHCFSCNFKGNIFTLVKDLTGKNVYEFLHLERTFEKPLKREKKKRKRNIKKLVNLEGKIKSPYENNLVIEYLKKRFITDNIIKDFSIKYCDYVKINETIFRNRILIPIIKDNVIISYEGRDFTERQKPKVLYPKNSNMDTLFNIDNLNVNEDLIIVEGLMDIPKIYENISKNVTCLFGSNPRKNQLEQLSRFKNIILIPDNDEAGVKLMITIYKNLHRNFQVGILEKSDDPGDAILDELSNTLLNTINIYTLTKKYSFLNEFA